VAAAATQDLRDPTPRGIRCKNAASAVKMADEKGRAAIMFGENGGRSVGYMVVTERETLRLATLRVSLGHLFLHQGQIVSIPTD
jgi:hypothetical protein